MKKIICMVLTLVFLFLAACSSAPKQIDLAAVKTSIVADLSVSDPLDLKTERLGELYGIDAADVKASACFITLNGTFPDEVVMIEAVDASAAKRISEKLNARLADTVNQAKNYDAESFALLQQCKVQTVGNYVTMFISAQNAEMQKIFDAAAK